jgi:hypothetical protein
VIVLPGIHVVLPGIHVVLPAIHVFLKALEGIVMIVPPGMCVAQEGELPKRENPLHYQKKIWN